MSSPHELPKGTHYPEQPAVTDRAAPNSHSACCQQGQSSTAGSQLFILASAHRRPTRSHPCCPKQSGNIFHGSCVGPSEFCSPGTEKAEENGHLTGGLEAWHRYQSQALISSKLQNKPTSASFQVPHTKSLNLAMLSLLDTRELTILHAWLMHAATNTEIIP